ncbi:NAD(P)H-binding protein [Pseudonocardia sp. HH130630-07]|uniref:NAD(P)H-binding protein n=1 Tax=Pseudonocardia sp. HH130630-07 TaxID=1690815 RepID=UPI000814DA6A|nr:NAD(P)H-binding protein [Pseudonocardia sp. HH130630-07]ANY10367.1 NAD(P)-dependent oxidoreductase [Pseudonocardia sp. HH130630-07]
MTGVLVTGGTGKTGRVLAATLRAGGVPVRVASRHPDPGAGGGADADAVVFDWDDPATHRAALAGTDRVYLVAPPLEVDPLVRVAPFLDEADRQGVRKVVFLGSAIEFPGAPGMLELADRVRNRPGGVVLLPSAFMQNFLRPHPMAVRIRADGEIRTAAGTGGVGWIDAADIAASAAALLSDPAPDPHDEYLLTGPRALSYHDAAAIVTAGTGRPVRVVDVEVAEVAAANRAAGLPPAFAESLAAVEIGIRAHGDERISTSVLELTGRAPRSFEDFVRRHADEWAP